MFNALSHFAQQYDPRLAVLSGLVCAVACVGAFGMQRRAWQTQGEVRGLWLLLTGLVAGSGLWAMHFVGVLAFEPRVNMAYSPAITFVSWLVAVGGAGAGFATTILGERRWSWAAAGLITAASGAAMTYLGIAAIHAPIRVTLAPGVVVAAAAFATVVACAAFWSHERLRDRWNWPVAALLLALGLVGFNFLGMVGVVLTPQAVQPNHLFNIGRSGLAIAAIGVSTLIFCAAFAQAWVEQIAHRSALASVGRSLDAVPAGIAFFDPDDHLIACNAAFRDLAAGVGTSVEPGASRRRIFEAAKAAGWLVASKAEPAERATVQPTQAETAVELRLPDGRWLHLEGFRSDQGSATVISDISDQKEQQALLISARDDAQAASAAKSAFLANMSHEIRTPLNGVLGVIEVLRRTDLSPQQVKLVETMQASGELLNDLLGDLLDLARAEAGAVRLKPEPTQIGALLRVTRDLYAGRAEAKGLGLDLVLAPGADTWVMCDPGRLQQVVGNLVNNAIKFTDRGMITIAANRAGDRLVLEVRDTGCGFNEAMKPTLFHRFQQADNSGTREHGGAGLGLAICDQYVRLMGGAIDCYSQPDMGATFAVDLPLPVIEAPKAAEPPPPPPPPANASAFQLLIVDDNPTNRQVLGLILDALDIPWAEAVNGEEGVAMAKGGAFAAVLMDIQMPVMDGLEAIRQIRAWEREAGRPRLPIYIVSANCLDEHIAAGEAAGADGHLGKPVTTKSLIEVLARIVPDEPPTPVPVKPGRGAPYLRLVES
ncbi:MAG: response regulator [Proteobacteria bacterium]|nr:response regulator [Pseudomonadota bacterium]